MEALIQRWQAWAMRIDALSFRERILILLAAAGVALSLMFVGLIEPALKRQEQMILSVSALQQEIFSLRGQLLEAEQKNKNGKNSEISRLRAEAATLDQAVKGHRGEMVPPDKMIGTLKSLLATQSGLTLISLHTLVPNPVFKEKAGEAAPQTPAIPPADQLYQHGVELRVQGSYAGLTDYVRRLEGLPWAIRWEGLSLDASRHPDIEMTLKLNTLSREATWAKF